MEWAMKIGDKVKNRFNIKGGMLRSDVPADTAGKITKVHWLTDKVDVEFVLHGREVTFRDIKCDDIKKA